jgi:hypothetical protein
MWLRPSGGTLRIADPVVGRVLKGDEVTGFEIGDRRAVVPADYALVGYGSMPGELRGPDPEGEGMAVGSQIFVIDLEGTNVIVASSAGEIVKPEGTT